VEAYEAIKNDFALNWDRNWIKTKLQLELEHLVDNILLTYDY